MVAASRRVESVPVAVRLGAWPSDRGGRRVAAVVRGASAAEACLPRVVVHPAASWGVGHWVAYRAERLAAALDGAVRLAGLQRPRRRAVVAFRAAPCLVASERSVAVAPEVPYPEAWAFRLVARECCLGGLRVAFAGDEHPAAGPAFPVVACRERGSIAAVCPLRHPVVVPRRGVQGRGVAAPLGERRRGAHSDAARPQRRGRGARECGRDSADWAVEHSLLPLPQLSLVRLAWHPTDCRGDRSARLRPGLRFPYRSRAVRSTFPAAL